MSFSWISVNEDDIDSVDDSIWPIITYIAGNCAFSVVKKLKCDYCSVFVVANDNSDSGNNLLIAENDRGGLQYPSEDVISCICHLYLLVKKITSDFENEFLRIQNQKHAVISLATEKLPTDLFNGFNCPAHNLSLLIKLIITPGTNILLNNYVKKRKGFLVKNKNMPTIKRI